MVRMPARSIGIGIMIHLMRIGILARTSLPELGDYSSQSLVPDLMVKQDAINSTVTFGELLGGV